METTTFHVSELKKNPKQIENRCADLLKLISDGLGFLMPLEPHHVLGVEPPRLLLQGFGCQILGLGALQSGQQEEEEMLCCIKVVFLLVASLG